eukprot:5873415-Prorocentrum_lima.AAC.1
MHPANKAGARTHPCGTPCVGVKVGVSRPGTVGCMLLRHVVMTASAATGCNFALRCFARTD